MPSRTQLQLALNAQVEAAYEKAVASPTPPHLRRAELPPTPRGQGLFSTAAAEPGPEDTSIPAVATSQSSSRGDKLPRALSRGSSLDTLSAPASLPASQPPELVSGFSSQASLPASQPAEFVSGIRPSSRLHHGATYAASPRLSPSSSRPEPVGYATPPRPSTASSRPERVGGLRPSSRPSLSSSRSEPVGYAIPTRPSISSSRPDQVGGLRQHSSVRPSSAPSGRRSLPSRNGTSLPETAAVTSLPSRYGTPSWSRPTSAWSTYTSDRAKVPRLYEGKSAARATLLGREGPGFYDVRCTRTGTPRGQAKGTPTFGGARRFNRDRCYEGKERQATLLGQYGPCDRPPPRCTRRGTTNWQAPTSAFGVTTEPRLVHRTAQAA